MGNRLRFTRDEARDIVRDDHEDFEVIEKELYDKSRWALHYDVIVKRISDDTLWNSYYSVGATEQQDQVPYEYDEPLFYRCELRAVTTYKYVIVEDEGEGGE